LEITENPSRSFRYLELDALRGLAAILVVLFHFTMKREQAKLGFNLGVTGVDLFFIISGFVIFMSLNNISSTKEFIINRFTRLYPTYWTCVTFTYVLYKLVGNYTNTPCKSGIRDYLGNLTMFQYYLKIPDLDGPYWSLIIEMTFYILIAIVFSLKKMKFIIPIGLLILFVILLQYIIQGTKIGPIYAQVWWIFPLLYHFQLFFAGIIFFKMKTETKNRLLYYVLLLISFIVQITSTDDKGEFINHAEHITMEAIYFGLFLLFVHNKLNYFIFQPALFLGKVSFALYLIHQYLGFQLLIPFLTNSWHLSFWLAALITLILVISLAAMITYYVEIPVGKRMNKFLRMLFKCPVKSELSSGNFLVQKEII
jgi:peptidoglycan/LPS O-acetylase OafA/YrhL